MRYKGVEKTHCIGVCVCVCGGRLLKWQKKMDGEV